MAFPPGSPHRRLPGFAQEILQIKHPALTPPYQGLLLPAEWEKQTAVWFTWPQNAATWTPVWEEAKRAYRDFIRAALRFQDVILLANDERLRDQLQKEFGAALSTAGRGAAASQASHKLDIAVCPTNDSWIRDYGAITVRDGAGKLVTLDFTFNSWGGKYPPWDSDDAVPHFMARRRDRQAVEVDFVLEGGSIDANGRGLLLTTTQCLLNENRNPKLNRDQIEASLRGWLGAEKTLWLDAGIHGDDTDGHIDDLARFSDHRTILCAIETNRNDENYEPLKANVAALNKYAKTTDLEVIEVPMPARLVKADLRTPATYMNFLIINGAVLAPVFQDRLDDRALQTLESAFKGREIIPIDCRGLVFGQGAIHCSSMQEPAG